MELYFFIWFFFIIKIYVYSETINEGECSRETPLLKISSHECVYETFIEYTHEISNSIIKTQWLNQINQLGESGYWYFGIGLSSTEDLIIQSFYFTGSMDPKRYIYGIKNNGRAMFYKDNKFTNVISII